MSNAAHALNVLMALPVGVPANAQSSSLGRPKALLAALVEQARKAGLKAHGNALDAYRSQFGGRSSYLEACESDRMETVVEAFDAWSCDTEIGTRSWGQTVVPADLVRALPRLARAFEQGWQDGVDGE